MEPSTFSGLNLSLLVMQNIGNLVILRQNLLSASSDVIVDEVKVENCGLVEVEDDVMEGATHLQFVSFAQNRLKLIPNLSSSSLSKLTHLKLSDNEIVSVRPLKNMPNLKQLFLQNNRIVTISHTAFLTTPLLDDLDLSHNHITLIDPTALTHLVQLKTLSINSNRLHHVVWEELPWKGPVQGGDLMEVRLYDNPWNCTCFNSFLVERSSTVQLYSDSSAIDTDGNMTSETTNLLLATVREWN